MCHRAIMVVRLLPVRPSTTGRTVISRVHSVSSCNHGCPSPPCQAINYWKNRHIKSPLCVIVQSWLSVSSLSGRQILEEPSYQESTVYHRAIMVVHLLSVRPSTTGRTHNSVNSSTTVRVLMTYKRAAKTTRWAAVSRFGVLKYRIETECFTKAPLVNNLQFVCTVLLHLFAYDKQYQCR